jgi:radical SAM-linked protein
VTSFTLFRLRICFAKQGRLIWLSHLELVRAMERCIRRANLPFQLSQGFNQHMKHSFGLALPVGTSGAGEYCDVWLTKYVPASVALASLQAVAVNDLPILSCEYINNKVPSLQTSHCLADYQILIRAPKQEFASGFSQLMDTGQLTIKKKNKNKHFDLGSAVVAWDIANPQPNPQPNQSHCELRITMRSSNDGALRPELLLEPVLADIPQSKIVRIDRLRLYPED